MAYTPGESGVFVWGNDLPDPGEGNVYELWMIEDGQPVRGGASRRPTARSPPSSTPTRPRRR